MKSGIIETKLSDGSPVYAVSFMAEGVRVSINMVDKKGAEDLRALLLSDGAFATVDLVGG